MAFVDRRTGQEINEFKHITQSIEMILTTRVGSRVMRRDFGSELPILLDDPLTPETITAIYAETNVAIARWEPRVRILGSRLDLDDASSGVYDLTLFLEFQGNRAQTTITL